MRLKLWGVRGSTPTPQIENLIYGGNTACVEVCSDKQQVIIFDGGSGVRNLGQALVEESSRKRELHLFLTHFHWDHIQGIPFFLPLYHTDNEMTFYASSHLGPLQERLQGQMSKPYFPVSMELGAHRRFNELDSAPVRLGDLTICPFPLNHPQGAYGYRIESPQGVIVYATDLEHGHPELDRVLRDYCRQASVLIYDAQYTPEEYATHKGWGHSTWLEATRVARDAGVERLILFHHDPWHSDRILFEIVKLARREFENTLIATEGWVIDL